jgi:hypothetical protein
MSKLQENIDLAVARHTETPHKVSLHLFVHADSIDEDVGINIGPELPADEVQKALRVLWELLRAGCRLDSVLLTNHTTEGTIRRRMK